MPRAVAVQEQIPLKRMDFQYNRLSERGLLALAQLMSLRPRNSISSVNVRYNDPGSLEGREACKRAAKLHRGVAMHLY